MKLNKFFLFASAALATVLTSCSKVSEYFPGEQDSDKPFVSLSETNVFDIELDPNDDAEISFTVCRRGSEGAVQIPLTVTENDESIFNIPEYAVFDDGETETTVKVTFPDLAIGTPASFRVSLGTEYAGIYAQGAREQKFTVTRVKWNPVGYYLDGGVKRDGWCMFTEDLLTTFFSVNNLSYPVEVQERADKPGYFRVFNAYGSAYPYNEPGDYDDSKDYYFIIDATNPNKVYIPSLTNLGFNWGYGDFYMWSMAGYYLSKGDESKAKDYYGTYKNGKISFPVGGLMIAMADYNDFGLYSANSNGLWSIVLDPSLQQYEADMENDFDYDEVFEGEFTSELLGSTSTSSLYVGTCTETKDDCDKRFEEQYGKIYKIVSPYAEDYHLTFFVKKGSIALPAGPEYDRQATGLTALGKDVYAHINTDKSVFEKDKVTLNITFTDAKGETIYGTTDEILEHVNWVDLGKGIMQDDIIIPLYGEDPVTYYVQVQTCDTKPGIYRIVDPFGPTNYPYYNALKGIGCTMPSAGKSILVNCEDPDAVYIERQSLDMDLGDGPIEFVSLGAYYLSEGYSFASIKNAGYFGKLNKTSGMITFPTITSNTGRDFQGYVYEAGEVAYYAGMDGKIAIQLPTSSNTKKSVKSLTPSSVSNKPLIFNAKQFKAPAIKSKKIKFTVRKSGKAPAVKSYSKTKPALKKNLSVF